MTIEQLAKILPVMQEIRDNPECDKEIWWRALSGWQPLPVEDFAAMEWLSPYLEAEVRTKEKPLLELWVNVYEHIGYCVHTKYAKAIESRSSDCLQTVHMREVREETK